MGGRKVESRADAIKGIMREMRDPAFAKRLRVRNEDGSMPIVVALGSDRVSDVVVQVEAKGGRANVAVCFDHGYAVLGFDERTPVAHLHDDDDEHVIHQDLQMEMLLEYLRARRVPVHFRVQINDVESTVDGVDAVDVTV